MPTEPGGLGQHDLVHSQCVAAREITHALVPSAVAGQCRQSVDVADQGEHARIVIAGNAGCGYATRACGSSRPSHAAGCGTQTVGHPALPPRRAVGVVREEVATAGGRCCAREPSRPAADAAAEPAPQQRLDRVGRFAGQLGEVVAGQPAARGRDQAEQFLAQNTRAELPCQLALRESLVVECFRRGRHPGRGASP